MRGIYEKKDYVNRLIAPANNLKGDRFLIDAG